LGRDGGREKGEIAEMPTFAGTFASAVVSCEGLQLDGGIYPCTIGGAPSPYCHAGTYDRLK